MDLLTGLGLAAPAGLNAYIPLLTVGVAQRAGWIALPEPYALLGETWALALVALLLLVELVADKVPLVDSANDLVQSFVRPAAGGLLVVASAGDGAWPAALLVAAGVVVAGGVHATKALARPAVNATTGGLGAPVVSAAEDAASLGMSVAALVMPLLALAAAVLLVLALVRLRRRRRRAAAAPPG